MNKDWKNRLHEKYRRKLGCKNPTVVCWCEICVNIETLINDVIKEVKKNI